LLRSWRQAGDWDGTARKEATFETPQPLFNARHGPAYVGLKNGIVTDTLVINHIPVNARLIGADEHESHYVSDLLFNNTTTIRPDLHSTDTQGANEVNFAILHAFMCQWRQSCSCCGGRCNRRVVGSLDAAMIVSHASPSTSTRSTKRARKTSGQTAASSRKVCARAGRP